MCGIVGAISKRPVESILIEGLRRLEYRGYDSAGIVLFDKNQQLARLRVGGKVHQLSDLMEQHHLQGSLGIAHTRWATHGKPSERNAHPHFSGDHIALVHNGIIENFEPLRQQLIAKGFHFNSETDTEVIAHLIAHEMTLAPSFLQAVQRSVKQLRGTYALAILSRDNPHEFIAVRAGAPLVVGLGFGENFCASDYLALLPVTQRFINLEDGDVALLTQENILIYDKNDALVERSQKQVVQQQDPSDKGTFRHYMQKEIFEQADAIRHTLAHRFADGILLEKELLGPNANALLETVENIHIIACGTSYHAGLVAKYWLEEIAGISCHVETASEFRYRSPVVPRNTLFIAISQSGETADTLAAIRLAKTLGYYTILTICNVAESAMVRESNQVILTHAGREIGVASTKAFTTQLCVLLMLTVLFGRNRLLTHEKEQHIVQQLQELPTRLSQTLNLDGAIKTLAQQFAHKNHTLFLGRGTQFPVALEGALKLKEISYIHAQAYPAGELKHGPLALVDKDMCVIMVIPNNHLLEKVKSNLQEVRARGGQIIAFADEHANITSVPGITVIDVPTTPDILAPIIYTIPLQLLAYHVAVLKGTDVDQPRNLAKSVTVE